MPPTTAVALLPCKPDRAERSVPLGGEPTPLSVLGCEAGGATFALMAAKVPAGRAPDALLAGWQQATLANMQASGMPERQPFHPARGLPLANAQRVVAQGRQADGRAVAAQAVFDDGKTLFSTGKDWSILRALNLMTPKPFLYVFNADESVLTDEAKQAELRALVAPADAVFLDAKIESELIELDDESANELLESIGQTERGLDALARAGFHTLRLQTYLTAGPKEARAWTIHQGDTAPKAAGVIHTDFEKGFIRAEVVAYDDFIQFKGEQGAKEAGKWRLEGKDYIVKDGDVMHFRFNV